jgi:hypothetical protein
MGMAKPGYHVTIICHQAPSWGAIVAQLFIDARGCLLYLLAMLLLYK